ncbi:arylsulfotransferase family protein [Salinisphaera sp. LB1]|uniref:arylsulfotransferase family protein n=1 Tax=Salinisphaera sp. LB1 TaxID=2183911 RepID=UPI000D705D03|nr:arylsulfotransferase family protein [Salinisphaera sp. LB1]AWN14418.1 putative PQQ enzyme repeat [Salinisphaera sp. LB1]
MEKGDRAGLTAFFIGCLFFAFLGGAYIVLAQVFPYKFLDNAYRAGWALVQQKHTIDSPFTQTDQWRKARSDKRGTAIYDPKRAYNGYTLYTSGGRTTAYLIDMQGHVVHQWHADYSKLWQTTPDGREAQPDKLMYFRKAVMYPNGDLLAIFIAAGDTPWGYGLVKLDANSNVIWKYHGATHHDLYLTDDNRVFILTDAYRDQPVPGFRNLKTPWLDDYLVELNGENGQVVKKISIFDALWHSRYQALLGADPSFAMEDPLHTNSVQYLGDALGKAFAPAQGNGDQVLLSTRHPGLAVLLDVKSGQVTWALKGSWLGQHSMRALPNGHFTIFDNYGNFEKHNMSRILEVDPTTHAITWQYAGNAQHPFSNLLRGAVVTLPNGDRLITESDGGRLFEVAPNGDIVWEYDNPIRGGDHNQYIPVVSSGQRIKPDQLAPAFRRSLNTSQE